jgi:hypothetical protein
MSRSAPQTSRALRCDFYGTRKQEIRENIKIKEYSRSKNIYVSYNIIVPIVLIYVLDAQLMTSYAQINKNEVC